MGQLPGPEHTSASAFPRGSPLVGWQGAQIPPFHLMASALAEARLPHMPDKCHQTPPKKTQQPQNSPLLDELPRNRDLGTALVSCRAFFMLAGCSLLTPRPRTASPGYLRGVRSSALYGRRPRSSTGWYDHTGLHLVFVSVLPVCNCCLPRCVCRCWKC